MLYTASHSAFRAVRKSPIHSQYLISSISRLLSTLAILEQRDGKLNRGSLCAVAAAKKLGGPVTGFLAGSNIQKAAEDAAKGNGLDEIVTVENTAYEKGLPETYAPLLVANIQKGEYTHIIASHSAFGKTLLPRVAALLDIQQVSDITSIDSPDTFTRPIYAGNAILTVQTDDSPKILTVRGTSFAHSPSEASSTTAPITPGTDPSPSTPTTWLSESLSTSSRPELSSATRVVSGGRGLKTAADFSRLMNPLADSLGAAIGASRAAVDSGFADNSLQVGQTGKNVAPQLYLCAGVSGAIQHLAGMKDSKVIVAVNKDGDAPIMQIADVGLVGDAFVVLPELTEKLEEMKKG